MTLIGLGKGHVHVSLTSRARRAWTLTGKAMPTWFPSQSLLVKAWGNRNYMCSMPYYQKHSANGTTLYI